METAHMHNFFDSMTPWPRNDGSLHLYVVPDEPGFVDRLLAAQSRIASLAQLPPMPAPYLHCTVQRLAHFDHEIRQADLTRLARQLNSRLAEVRAFELEFGRPQVGSTAIECVAEPDATWDHLVAAVRRAAVDAWGDALPPAPYGPHLSLAYCTGDLEDALVAEHLAGSDPIGSLRVDKIHLVSVTVRPEVGIFDFVTLADWELPV